MNYPVPEVKSPVLACIFSLIIPGVGQMYNGQFGKGVLMLGLQLLSALLATIGIGVFTGLIVAIWSAVDAYQTAKRINLEAAQRAGYIPPGYAAQAVPQPSYPPPAQLPGPNGAPTTNNLAPGMKVCPRCAEQVQAAAQMCRFCGYEFVAGAAAAAPAGAERSQ